MSLINGDKLRIDQANTDRKVPRTSGPGMLFPKRQFVCPHKGCAKRFSRYPGMRQIGSGVALCEEHQTACDAEGDLA